MRISRKTEYALRTAMDLADHEKDGTVRVSAIAERQHIPANFLAQILLALKAGGIVRSKRGIKGGYYLARCPSETTLSSIVLLTENSFSPRDGESDADGDGLPLWHKHSPFREVWLDIDDYILKKLEATTLEDMCRRAKQLRDGSVAEYAI